MLLLNLGGPETLKDVKPFLYNLFADDSIIRLPPQGKHRLPWYLLGTLVHSLHTSPPILLPTDAVPSCSPLPAEASSMAAVHLARLQECRGVREDWWRLTLAAYHGGAGQRTGCCLASKGTGGQCVCGHAVLEALHRRRCGTGKPAILRITAMLYITAVLLQMLECGMATTASVSHTTHSAHTIPACQHPPHLDQHLVCHMRCDVTDVMPQVKKDGITKLVVIPLYPQFSISTSASSLRLFEEMLDTDPALQGLSHIVIASWYWRKGYLQAMTELIADELPRFPDPKSVQVIALVHPLRAHLRWTAAVSAGAVPACAWRSAMAHLLLHMLQPVCDTLVYIICTP